MLFFLRNPTPLHQTNRSPLKNGKVFKRKGSSPLATMFQGWAVRFMECTVSEILPLLKRCNFWGTILSVKQSNVEPENHQILKGISYSKLPFLAYPVVSFSGVQNCLGEERFHRTVSRARWFFERENSCRIYRLPLTKTTNNIIHTTIHNPQPPQSELLSAILRLFFW